MEPKVSVIIPTYNREQKIQYAIRSVLRQAYQNFEIIIVDDGSTDNTEQLIEDLQKKDSRVKYLKQENSGGTSKPRNLGISKSRGKYLAFLDSDDEWMETKLEKQLELFRNSDDPNLGFVACNAIIINKREESKIYSLPKYKNYFKEFLTRTIITSCSSVVIKKSVINKVGGFDENLKTGVDWEMWIRISKSFNFNFVDEPLIKYYVHKNNISSPSNIAKREKDLRYIFEKYKPYYKKHPLIYSKKLRYDGTRYTLENQTKKAKKYFLKSILIFPLNLKSYLYLLFSLGGYNFYSKLVNLKRLLKNKKIMK